MVCLYWAPSLFQNLHPTILCTILWQQGLTQWAPLTHIKNRLQKHSDSSCSTVFHRFPLTWLQNWEKTALSILAVLYMCRLVINLFSCSTLPTVCFIQCRMSNSKGDLKVPQDVVHTKICHSLLASASSLWSKGAALAFAQFAVLSTWILFSPLPIFIFAYFAW